MGPGHAGSSEQRYLVSHVRKPRRLSRRSRPSHGCARGGRPPSAADGITSSALIRTDLMLDRFGPGGPWVTGPPDTCRRTSDGSSDRNGSQPLRRPRGSREERPAAPHSRSLSNPGAKPAPGEAGLPEVGVESSAQVLEIGAVRQATQNNCPQLYPHGAGGYLARLFP